MICTVQQTLTLRLVYNTTQRGHTNYTTVLCSMVGKSSNTGRRYSVTLAIKYRAFCKTQNVNDLYSTTDTDFTPGLQHNTTGTHKLYNCALFYVGSNTGRRYSVTLAIKYRAFSKTQNVNRDPLDL